MKSVDQFNRNRTMRDGPNHWCKPCKKLAYRENAVKYRALTAAASRRRKDEALAKIKAYKLAHPCVDCGEADPIVLDFDHVRGDKLADVSRMVTTCRPWAVIAAEIGKCEVRCANCHRRKTHRERLALKEIAVV